MVIKVINMVLVGSNPMPCYVQAAYLMNQYRSDCQELPVPNEQVFIHTVATQNFMSRICEMLQNKYGSNGTLLSTINLESEAEGKAEQENIRGKITNWLNDKMEKESIDRVIVILNNTGGTKVMTTYATIALREWCRENPAQLIECYLDDATKKLNCVRSISGGNEAANSKYDVYPKEKNLGYFVHLSVAEIGYLHGYKECVNKNGALFVRPMGEAPADDGKQADFEDALKLIAKKILNDDEFRDLYLKLFARLSYLPNFKDRAGKICTSDFQYDTSNVKKPQILQLFDQEQDGRWFHYANGFTACSPSYGGCWISLFQKMGPLSKKQRNQDKISECMSMYTNDWFEHYVYMAVRDAVEEEQERCGGDMPEVELVWSLEVKRDSKDKGFELDIVMSVGFELKVISLTIDDNSLMAKHKFFEAVFRGEILGGTHSQVIAVNWAENREALKKELSSFSGEQYHHVEIWGKDEVKDYDKLKNLVRELLRSECPNDCGEDSL